LNVTRTRIVAVLAAEALCVYDVAAVVGLSISTASRQLMRLPVRSTQGRTLLAAQSMVRVGITCYDADGWGACERHVEPDQHTATGLSPKGGSLPLKLNSPIEGSSSLSIIVTPSGIEPSEVNS
jgi:hypothetical protein